MLTNFARNPVEPDSSEFQFVSERFYDSFKHLNIAPPLPAPVNRSGPPAPSRPPPPPMAPLGPVLRPSHLPPALLIPTGSPHPPPSSASLVPMNNLPVSHASPFPLHHYVINTHSGIPASTPSQSQNPPPISYASGLPLPPPPIPAYTSPNIKPMVQRPVTMNPTPINANNPNPYHFLPAAGPAPSSHPPPPPAPAGSQTQPQPQPSYFPPPSLSMGPLFGTPTPSHSTSTTAHRHRRANLAAMARAAAPGPPTRPGRNNTMPQIRSIERIQNQRWYKQYVAHELEFKQKMGKQTQEWLFHGERIDRSIALRTLLRTRQFRLQ